MQGSNGGALDRLNSSYLVKSAQTPWAKDCLLAVDAGVLASGILDILTNQLLLENERQVSQHVQSQKSSFLALIYSNLFGTRRGQKQVQSRFSKPSLLQPQSQYIFPPEALPHERPVENTWHIINNLLSSVCVTHPHLDHVAGLVINSGNFSIFQPKVVAGLTSTIDSLLSYLFNGVIWPNLTNEGIDPVGMITLTRLRRAKPQNSQNGLPIPDPTLAQRSSRHGLATNLSVLAFEVSHGTACQIQGRRRSSVASMTSSTSIHLSVPNMPTPTINPIHPNLNHPSTYNSTAYFITDTLTSKAILMWGDVEPDIVSMTPRNMPVWSHAAHLLSHNSLCAIFIECSYNSPHEDALLFGHFSPCHLIRELSVFASMCTTPTAQRLTGLPVIITHVKDEDPLLWNTAAANDSNSNPNNSSKTTGSNIEQCKQSPSHLILTELNTFAKKEGLECIFQLALPGCSFTF